MKVFDYLLLLALAWNLFIAVYSVFLYVSHPYYGSPVINYAGGRYWLYTFLIGMVFSYRVWG